PKRFAGAVGGGSAHRNARHTLNAAADGDVIAAGNYTLRGKMNRLLAGAALAVDGGAGNGFRKAGGEDSVASDVSGLLANLHDAASNHVIDLRGIKLVACDQAFQREPEKVDRVPGFQHAFAPAQRRTYCVNDDCFACHTV